MNDMRYAINFKTKEVEKTGEGELLHQLDATLEQIKRDPIRPAWAEELLTISINGEEIPVELKALYGSGPMHYFPGAATAREFNEQREMDEEFKDHVMYFFDFDQLAYAKVIGEFYLGVIGIAFYEIQQDSIAVELFGESGTSKLGTLVRKEGKWEFVKKSR
jgi:hypothetical protein